MELDVFPGDIWWAKPSPTAGLEQSGRRPIVIVSGQLFLEAVTTVVLAVPVTTTDRGWPNHILIDPSPGLHEASWAMTEQVRPISRDRLIARIGQVSPMVLQEIRSWIRDYLVD